MRRDRLIQVQSNGMIVVEKVEANGIGGSQGKIEPLEQISMLGTRLFMPLLDTGSHSSVCGGVRIIAGDRMAIAPI